MNTDLVIILCVVSFFLGIYAGNPRFRTSFHEAIRTLFDKDAGDSGFAKTNLLLVASVILVLGFGVLWLVKGG